MVIEAFTMSALIPKLREPTGFFLGSDALFFADRLLPVSDVCLS